MTKPAKTILGCILFILAIIVVIIAVELCKIRTQVAIVHTRQRLFLLSYASTNYASVYGVWPQSLDDLFTNKSNILFVISDPRKIRIDGWGRAFDYVPFNTNIGYGIIRSLGSDCKQGGSKDREDIEVHFDINRIVELSRDQN